VRNLTHPCILFTITWSLLKCNSAVPTLYHGARVLLGTHRSPVSHFKILRG
jgi:hypothetical protein